MTFKEDLEKALADAGFPGVLTRRTENVRTYQPKGTFAWNARKPAPVEWEIKFSTVLGEHPEWYSGILPKWTYDWHQHSVLRFIPIPDDEPQNDIPDLRSEPRSNFFVPEYIRCPKVLNLKALDMTWDKDNNCVALYQKHRPFMENDRYGNFYHFDRGSYCGIVPDVVKTMQLLKRIHDMAQPALENVNNTITGFRAQIKKVKAKNELLNEREKVKIKR